MSHTLHPLRRQRLHRSELAVPASNIDMVVKAADSDADVVFLDLEDAGRAPLRRNRPSKNAVKVAENGRIDCGSPRARTVSVRNQRAGHALHGIGDVVPSIMGTRQGDPGVDTLLVPKVGVPSDLYMVEAMVNQIETGLRVEKPGVGLEAFDRDRFGHGQCRSPSRNSAGGWNVCISALPTMPRRCARAPREYRRSEPRLSGRPVARIHHPYGCCLPRLRSARGRWARSAIFPIPEGIQGRRAPRCGFGLPRANGPFTPARSLWRTKCSARRTREVTKAHRIIEELEKG